MTKSDRSSKRQLPARPDRSKEPSYYDVSQQSTSWRSEAVVWGLMLARWLVPTEGTADGDTLWLTSLTLAAAAGFCWWMSRVSYEGLRLEKLDFAVGLFCGVHVLSAAVVILTEGNKRAATNMLWEWLGVAVTFFVIRQTITTLSRMQFLRTFLVVSTALACYGIWQPAFWYPSNLRDYETLRAELDAVDSSSELSSQEQIARRRELQAQFLSQGIPLSGSSRQLFERRLRDSSEPLGFFALTNTFAGFMTMSLVLLAGVLLKSLLPFASECSTDPPPGNAEITSRATIVAFGIAFLLVAYCLFLTKSRSAWGGALAGLTTLVGLCVFRSQSGRVLKHVLPVVAIGAVALSLLAGVAIFTGALDIEVISEAPRSLRYRIEYWTSTWDVILDHPLLGTGPGNFREYYLQYKLPWSSEEIADPHQFVLDVTANAGFAGLLGLAALLLSMAALAWNVCRHFASGATSFGHHRSDFPPETGTCPRRVIAVAGTVTIAGEWLFSGTFSVHVLSVCALAAGLDIVLSTVLQRSADARKLYDDRLEIPSLSVVAAIVAIFVHLSAAGGIAMPAVIVSILALAAVLKADVVSPVIEPGASELKRQKTPDARQVDADHDHRNRGWLSAALFAGLAALGCTTTAFVPVIQATSLLQLADYEAVNGQQTRRVISIYKAAAEADTLSPEPYFRMTQYYLHQWKQTREPDLFERSIESAKQALIRSPHSPHAAHELGRAWLVRAIEAAPKDEAAALVAVEELQIAVNRYPSHPIWNAEVAQAFALTGKEDNAADFAERALKLDDGNRAAGHVDRYLSDDLLAVLKNLTNVAE